MATTNPASNISDPNPANESSNSSGCPLQGPISGTYSGTTTGNDFENYSLDLRVDIDPSYPNSPVLNIISGDIWQSLSFQNVSQVPSPALKLPVYWQKAQESRFLVFRRTKR